MAVWAVIRNSPLASVISAGRGMMSMLRAEPDAEAPDLLGVGRAQRFELPAPQPEGLHRGRFRAQPCAVTGDVGRQGRLVFDQPPVLGAVMAAGEKQQCGCKNRIRKEVFFHDFRVLVPRKIRRLRPVRFLFFRKKTLHRFGDAFGDEGHQRLPVAARKRGDAPVVGEEKFVERG